MPRDKHMVLHEPKRNWRVGQFNLHHAVVLARTVG